MADSRKVAGDTCQNGKCRQEALGSGSRQEKNNIEKSLGR